jgi:hypothetical protein
MSIGGPATVEIVAAMCHKHPCVGMKRIGPCNPVNGYKKKIIADKR